MIRFSSARSLRAFSLILLFFLLTFSSCAPPKNYFELPENYYPLLIDDGDKGPLLTALNRQLHYLKKFPRDKSIKIGEQSFAYGTLVESLETFGNIIRMNLSPYELDDIIRKTFTVYQAEGRKRGTKHSILLTGYYEPLFEGSLTRGGPFQYPLYRVPDTLITREHKNSGKRAIGRISTAGSFIPYWSRAEIEQNNLLRGNELVYMRDPMDAYLLHVQGSGRIQLQDGTTRAVHFGGSNGLSYKSLGKLFVDRNIMELQAVSIPSMREYFVMHPDHVTPMLHNNPRYIFFKWGSDSGPKGSLGEILTPGRSVAIDHSIFPAGALGYLVSRRPVLNEDGSIQHWQSFSRFVLPQDSGSAIKGAGRVDLFWGAGTYARTAANHMKELGAFYFLIKKQF